MKYIFLPFMMAIVVIGSFLHVIGSLIRSIAYLFWLDPKSAKKEINLLIRTLRNG